MSNIILCFPKMSTFMSLSSVDIGPNDILSFLLVSYAVAETYCPFISLTTIFLIGKITFLSCAGFPLNPMKHCSADESVILEDELRLQLLCFTEEVVRILCNFYFGDIAEGGKIGEWWRNHTSEAEHLVEIKSQNYSCQFCFNNLQLPQSSRLHFKSLVPLAAGVTKIKQ